MKLIKSYRIWLRSAFLLTAIFSCIAVKTSAQTHGYPGTWKRVSTVAPGYSMNFADSLNGIAFGAGVFISTSNGGKTWDSAGSISRGLTIPFVNPLACMAPRHAIVAKTNCEQLELDGDSIFQADCPQDAPDSFYEAYSPFAQKMYDTSYGFRFVQVAVRGSLLNMAYMAVTHDGWRNYEAYGDSLIGTELSMQGPQAATEIDGATIVDSNEVWVGVNRAIYRTTNAGISWDTLYPLAGTADSNVDPEWYNFIVNRVTKEVYAVSGVAPIDYAYSSDYGKTWKIDSAFKGRIARLYVPSPDTLWAAVGHFSVGPQVWYSRMMDPPHFIGFALLRIVPTTVRHGLSIRRHFMSIR